MIAHGLIPAAKMRAHHIAQVGDHCLGIGDEGPGALLDVIARERDPRLHELGIEHRVAADILELFAQNGARAVGRVVGENLVGRDLGGL